MCKRPGKWRDKESVGSKNEPYLITPPTTGLPTLGRVLLNFLSARAASNKNMSENNDGDDEDLEHLSQSLILFRSLFAFYIVGYGIFSARCANIH